MKLKEHQVKAVEKFKENRGLILYHNLGSGKTVTSIGCGEEYAEKQKIVIVPASLQENYKKELKKFGANVNMYSIYSYEMFAKINNNDICTDKIVIADEAHRLRSAYDGGKTARNILNKLKMADKILFLSGTPIVNNPFDIVPLINVIYNSNVLPINKKEFNNQYMNYFVKKKGPTFLGVTLFGLKENVRNVTIKNPRTLKNIFRNVIDYYENINIQNYPSKEEIVEQIVMTRLQQKYHTNAMKSALTRKEIRMMKYGYGVDLDSKAKSVSRINSFLNKTRQIVNYLAVEKTSPKFERVKEIMASEKKPTLIYSNFKNAGVTNLHKMLSDIGYKCAIFSGSETIKEKKKYVNEYNTGKLDALLITASGSEGIDLKKTRQIIILEPHWNHTRIKQAIGRGIRYLSHANLNINNRNVKVYHLLSVYPKSMFGTQISSDEYLYKLTKTKQNINDKFLSIISKP